MQRGKGNQDGGMEKDDLERYYRVKERYMALCKRYDLNPFDLGIPTITACRMPKTDKCELLRLALSMIRLEKELRGKIGKGLFPLTVEESERSGYLVPVQH